MMPTANQVWLVVEAIDMRVGIDGHFTWPSVDTPVCTLTAAQWQWLVAGVDWQRLEAPPPAHWRV